MPKGISIIIPTYNEEKNIQKLISRIRSAFLSSGVNYEIIFIDDDSTDGTAEEINKYSDKAPIKVYTRYLKHGFGKRGKADSLLVGFDLAKYDSICMIDADLQYPPEAILPMYKKLDEADIVVADLNKQENKHKSSICLCVFNKNSINLDKLNHYFLMQTKLFFLKVLQNFLSDNYTFVNIH